MRYPPLTSLKNNKLTSKKSIFKLTKLSIALLGSIYSISNANAWTSTDDASITADPADDTYFSSGSGTIATGVNLTKDIAGKYSADSNVSGGVLTSNAVVSADTTIYGGYSQSGTASGNTVYLTGGSINGYVIGGQGTETTNNNSVYICGNVSFSNTSVIKAGSNAQNVTGNTLYFGNGTTSWDNGGNLSLGIISNFSTIKFNSVVWGKTITIDDMNVTEGGPVTVAKVDASQVNFTGVDSLSNGQNYEMLHINMLTISNPDDDIQLTSTESTYTIGTTVEGTGTVSLVKTDQGGYDSVSVTYTVGSSGSAKASSQSHAAAMTASAATVALTQGADTTSNALSNLSNSGVTGVQAFSSVGGGTARVETGSHININSLNFSVGVGTNKNTDYGLFSIGGAFEAGYGKFKNHYNAGTAEPYVKKSGDVHYYGVALLSNLTLENLWHFNGALRVGRIESSQNKALYNAATGQTYDIDIGSVYYGAELGVGKIIKIDDSNSLDIYGKYFYLYQDGDKFNAGGKYEVSSINSHRLRIAGRYTHDFTHLTSIYGGLGIEHEFDGKAKFKADGYWGEPSKTKGTRGYGEVGVTIKPASAAGLNFDLGVKTLCGEEYRGIWATAEVKYLF